LLAPVLSPPSPVAPSPPPGLASTMRGKTDRQTGLQNSFICLLMQGRDLAPENKSTLNSSLATSRDDDDGAPPSPHGGGASSCRPPRSGPFTHALSLSRLHIRNTHATVPAARERLAHPQRRGGHLLHPLPSHPAPHPPDLSPRRRDAHSTMHKRCGDIQIEGQTGVQHLHLTSVAEEKSSSKNLITHFSLAGGPPPRREPRKARVRPAGPVAALPL
jgi:hypothetical protein